MDIKGKLILGNVDATWPTQSNVLQVNSNSNNGLIFNVIRDGGALSTDYSTISWTFTNTGGTQSFQNGIEFHVNNNPQTQNGGVPLCAMNLMRVASVYKPNANSGAVLLRYNSVNSYAPGAMLDIVNDSTSSYATTLRVEGNGTAGNLVYQFRQDGGGELQRLYCDGRFIHNISNLSTADFTIEGGTDANLFFTDAGADEIGIGTNGPAGKLHIVGNGSTSGTFSLFVENSSGADILKTRDEGVVLFGQGNTVAGITNVSVTDSEPFDVGHNIYMTSTAANNYGTKISYGSGVGGSGGNVFGYYVELGGSDANNTGVYSRVYDYVGSSRTHKAVSGEALRNANGTGGSATLYGGYFRAGTLFDRSATNATAVYAQLYFGGSGTITNATGVDITTDIAAGDTATTITGLKVNVGTLGTVTNRYAATFINGNVGIGTTSPSASLDVVGTLQYVDGNEADGYVLTSDASGNATWQAAPSGATDTNYYTTGATLTGGTTLVFDRNDTSNAYNVDLSSLKFTGNTSGDCISDIWVSNIHSCSPLYVNPNNEGDIYLVGNGGNVGIGVSATTGAGRLEIKQTNSAVDGIYIDLNLVNNGGQRKAITINNSDPSYGGGAGAELISLEKQNTSGYPIIKVNDTNGTSLLQLQGTTNGSWFNQNIVIGSNAGSSSERLYVRGAGSGFGAPYLAVFASNTSGDHVRFRTNGYTEFNVSQTTSSDFHVYGASTSPSSNALFVDVANGRTGIGGTFSPSTNPSARLHVKGAGSTSATSPFLVENSSGNDIIDILDDGTFEIGLGATSNSTNNVAIGNSATATGTSSTAIGYNTDAFGNSSVAIGNGASSPFNYSIAIGQSAACNSVDSVAIGRLSVTAQRAVAIGQAANAGADGVSIGDTSDANGNSISIGDNAGNSTSINAVMIGQSAGRATGTLGGGHVSIGQLSNGASGFNIGANSVAIGLNTKSTANNSVAIGGGSPSGATASGLQAIAIGFNTKSTSTSSIAIGDNSDATASGAIVLGYGTSSASNAFTLGYGTNSTANSFAISWGDSSPLVLLADTANQYISGAGNLGIGTGFDPNAEASVATATLQIGTTATTETFRYVDGNQSSGYVLTSDASGNATWQAAPGGSAPGKYSITTGFTASVGKTITHNLGTEDVIVNLWDSNVQTDGQVEVVDSNNITVTMASTATFKVVVVG